MNTATSATFPFDNSYAQLPDRFYARLDPAPVKAPRLIKLNEALARELGLDAAALNTREGVEIFAGNRTPEGAFPLAMAYAGHQFGGWVPQLGDGRAILLGEVVDRNGRRRDIQLKGSGRTPYSRMGDGRAPLGPVIREYIVSEAMAALGVPTTRSLAVVATGEPVFRETALPGGVLTRVAASHIRVGSFQFFAARQDVEGLRKLADHVIERHYPELQSIEERYAGLLHRVVERQADLVAEWMGLGFIHGVMNTDNMTISGETIDYGPCAFMDEYRRDQVFSSIDQQGRYAYGNQPPVAHWNLVRLAQAMLPLFAGDDEAQVAVAQEAVDRFPALFREAWLGVMRRKLGLDTV
ncbi:MAG TPA: YdiU family protein, partial [Alphaproteobacteria bacterium]|nr:YdiU family protein [Alphaproteobacteria bacterium]